MPKPMTAVLATSTAHCSRPSETTHPSMGSATMSTKMLNTYVNGSWLNVSSMRFRSRMIAHSMTIITE